MITLLESDDHTVRRCEALIRKHCPRLMKIGGGPIHGENLDAGKPVGAAEIARMVELRAKRWPMPDIAAAIGRSVPTVSKYLQQAGVARFRTREIPPQPERVAALRAQGGGARGLRGPAAAMDTGNADRRGGTEGGGVMDTAVLAARKLR